MEVLVTLKSKMAAWMAASRASCVKNSKSIWHIEFYFTYFKAQTNRPATSEHMFNRITAF